jgi:hypothetical protein
LQHLALYSQTISGNGSLIYVFSCVTDIHNNFILLCISPFVQAANGSKQTAELWLLLRIITYIGKAVVAVWCATIENEILAKSFCDHISTLKMEGHFRRMVFSHMQKTNTEYNPFSDKSCNSTNVNSILISLCSSFHMGKICENFMNILQVDSHPTLVLPNFLPQIISTRQF